MMKVELKPHPYDKSLVQLFSETEFLFNLPLKLSKKITLKGWGDHESFLAHIYEKALPLAKETAAYLLSRKTYLSHELKDKLLSKGYSETVSNETIHFFLSHGYLNDSSWTQHFVEKLIRKGKGPKLILLEGKQKKISLEELNEHISHLYPENVQIEKALHTLKKSFQDLSTPKDKQKAYQKLLQKGFSNEIIQEVLVKFHD
jgi:SOS response regulatory protein OraA/RecX